ncbi:hypothetical protein B5K08_22345 [Rhizobium leguminosarum bv. trifolii]|uniref:Uncharacterized protein n=1 Tax=Rhizobium leguminosarum bv. trifolii TaxID=386 RepID=A0A3E1B7J5_RHILT|nr:hypothetical protein [Rhizobium leguminosarum]RFB87192.1 hypothetical protein B5K08_22345 [Rhizobium leguminosarum bv. trifolii]RFB87373.1 hypothetical protein B5K10_22335 [Rhizobium leguminosarum bv. trifolii]
MDYHLDRRLRFLAEPKYASLYSWAINEIDDYDKVVGGDQIPWGWNLYFTGVGIVLGDQISVTEASKFEGRIEQKAEISHQRTIRVKLRPGAPRGDGKQVRQSNFRMFGTDRVITDIQLDILPLKSESDIESCRAWGSVSYTSETDFGDETQEDCLNFNLMVKPSTFELYANRITSGSADQIIFSVGMVTGFYSDWSPSISTSDVKVLTTDREHDVELAAGRSIPRLGTVGEARLYINAERVPQIHRPQNVRDAGMEHEKPTMPIVAAVGVERQATGADPQTLKLLGSLKSSARWIIGLLAALLIATLLER